jgi:chorismate mutase
MNTKTKDKYYVYAILVDGAIKYVGKGSNGKEKVHLKLVLSIVRRRAVGEVVRTSRFHNELAKAWLAGSTIEEVILHSDLTERQALGLEVKEIKRRRKALWNTHSGGENLGSWRGTMPPRRRYQQESVQRHLSKLYPPGGKVPDRVPTETVRQQVAAALAHENEELIRRGEPVMPAPSWETVHRALGRDRQRRK